MAIASKQVQCRRGPIEAKDKAICLPGTTLPCPDLRPMHYLEALHQNGYVVDGMSIGVYMFEALKLMRNCFLNSTMKIYIIPLRGNVTSDVYKSWEYAMCKIRYMLIDINLKERYVLIKTNRYSNKPIKLKENG